MKLGVSSPLHHVSAAEWAKKHKELGLEAIHFPLNYQDDPGRIDQYVKEAKAAGLLLAEVGVWKNTLDIQEHRRQEAIGYAKGQLALADRIGAACCVNILGSRGARWDGAYKENLSKDTWKLAVRTIQEMIDEVNPKNTYYTIEPMPWMYPMGPDEYLHLIEEVDRPRFAVHLDVFNWMTTPRRYFYNEEFVDECFEKLGAYIKSCHLKDVRLEENYTIHFQETCPGGGGINLAHLIRRAEAYQKDMPFIIEHLETDEEYLTSIDYVKKLVKESR